MRRAPVLRRGLRLLTGFCAGEAFVAFFVAAGVSVVVAPVAFFGGGESLAFAAGEAFVVVGAAFGVVEFNGWAEVAGASAASVAPPALNHASHPPTSARADLKPFLRSICAARALVASLGQAQ